MSAPNSPVYNLTHDYEGDFWNDRDYLAGTNGEWQFMVLRDHTYSPKSPEGGNGFSGCYTYVTPGARCHTITVTAAPGESFADNLTGSSPLAGYDQSKGVAFQGQNSLGSYPWPKAALVTNDMFVIVSRIQFKALGDVAGYAALTTFNYTITHDAIIEGAGVPFFMDAGSSIANSLIIARSRPIGINIKYGGGLVSHNTIVNLSGSGGGGEGIAYFWSWIYPDMLIDNNIIIGFSHGSAALDNYAPVWHSSSVGNITDAPIGDIGTNCCVQGDGSTGGMHVMTIPGTRYGVTASSVFVNGTNDFRIPNTSPAYGAGAAFGNFNTMCDNRAPGCTANATLNYDSPDIINQTRPVSGRYDSGAWQFGSTLGRLR